MAGQGTPATALLARRRIAHRTHPYDVSPDAPNYGALVAVALGVPAERVFKSLVTEVDGALAVAVVPVDGALAVAVVPVAGELDLKALAAALSGKRATMADRTVAERATGYVRGGISPLGQRKRLPTVLDESALRHDTVYVSAGRRGLQVELSPRDLVDLTGAATAPIAAA
ncbi:Cys-tRNA(Pro) deacylase [Micromonospora sp. WMMA1363]|uniref:Cys-tRNA(Pro) deacylase n=1 Tax=Micromonospora sp. WMMA1363 TaxID=3053985 RepID=UPI00259D2BAF|nr:Cys-tRNA(Pro) deacylase [Micromonospora sp. WMMA1363]MDM4720746.1 Cys-tRNA(Pro) deacylase [Micromonospora sp. WMMA1363]